MNDNLSVVLRAPEELVLGFNNPLAPTIRESAVKARDELVEMAQGIERVAGASSQQAATDMLTRLTKVLTGIEQDRKRVKEPFLNFGRKLDGDVSGFIQPLEKEKSRIKGLIAAFAEENLRKEREAREAQERALAKAAAERREAELAAQIATTKAEQEKAQEQIAKADAKAVEAVMAPVVAAPKAEGLKIKQSWKVEVVDGWALGRAFPELVDPPKARMSKVVEAVKNLAATNPNEPPTLPGCKVSWGTDVSSR